MSLNIILSLMFLMGFTGGTVNFLLPANTDPVTHQKIRSLFSCVILGIGATILVPLFLEFAQSKLLDDINAQNNSAPPIKNYFLFTSYCFLAAAAGFRFINSLIENVLKDKKIAELKKQKGEIEQRSNKLEKEITKVDAHNKLRMEKEESQVLSSIGGLTRNLASIQTKPVIGPVTHSEDPQKGRFGGVAEKNHRRLDASVSKSLLPGYYNVKVWVESTDPATYPLSDDVVFYLHDSFSPSVYSIPVNKFSEGKAVDDEIIAFGAFTVGAVTDKGLTLLELDLAEDQRFPQSFRDR